MSTCPSCSTTVDDRERFCEACGATLSPGGDTAATADPTADPTAAAPPETVEAVEAAAQAPAEAATHGAGCSTKWSRGTTALVPQVSQ